MNHTRPFFEPTPPLGATAAADAPGREQVPQLPTGYELDGEIARGGMGVVYRARDVAMNREVAVKLLQDRFPRDGPTARRFIEEAQITGQLQHPGIPPIHHVGLWADGRPFLAMKLVRGRTLDDLLKADGPVNTLAVFEAIAQAVGYAHAHGVIHRDLKPANVMVGGFGEVQVMDWGLAKVMTRDRQLQSGTDPDATLGTEIRSLRDSHDETHAGSVMGTPAFMPPEQAIGAVDELDARSDVFGLGAILCVMLTGRPPYVGENAESTRKLAARAKLDEAFAALDRVAVEPELVALCKQCLNPEKAGRPADANAVADAVAGLRTAAEERAKQAEIARASEAVRVAESRKRQRLKTRFAIGLAATLAVGLGVSLWLAKTATDAKTAVTSLLVETTEAKNLAQRNHAVADERLTSLQRVYDGFVFDMQMLLVNRPDTQDLRRALVEKARAGLVKIQAEAHADGTPERTLVWTHLRLGDLELQQGNLQPARKEYQVALALAQKRVEADPSQPLARKDVGMGLVRLADTARELGETDAAVDLYQRFSANSLALAADASEAKFQRDLPVSYQRLGDMMLRLNRVADAQGYFKKMNGRFEQLSAADPTDTVLRRDLALSYEKLAKVALKLNDKPEACNCFNRAAAGFMALAKSDATNLEWQHDLALSHCQAGEILRSLARTAEARDSFRNCMTVAQRLIEKDPKSTSFHVILFVSYIAQAEVEIDAKEYATALDWLRKATANLEHMQHVGWFTRPEQIIGTVSLRERQAELARFKKTCTEALAMADAEFAFRQPAADIPALVQYRVTTLLAQTRPDEAAVTALRFGTWADGRGKGRGEQQYNAACFLALVAAADPTARESRISQSLEWLRKAAADGYFDARMIAHVKQDGDFNGIRAHAKFVAFLAELERVREPAPTPREASGPR